LDVQIHLKADLVLVNLNRVLLPTDANHTAHCIVAVTRALGGPQCSVRMTRQPVHL